MINPNLNPNLNPTPNPTIKLSLISLTLALAFGCAGPVVNDEQAANDADTDSSNVNTSVQQQVVQSRGDEFEKRVLTGRKRPAAAYVELAETTHSMSADAALAYQPLVHKPAKERTSLQQHIQVLPKHAMPESTNNETYQDIEQSAVKLVSLEPVSTFSIDVDTGSYTKARRMLLQGLMPPRDAIRIEEFLNYFDYGYSAPNDISAPFSVDTAIASAPWDAQKHIVRIALKGFEPDFSENAGSNLVFLLDVSGSMNQPDKLPLLKRSLSMLTSQLDANDKVSIVVYAGASGVVLEPTNGNDKITIDAALSALQAGGGTNGAAGIELAYQLAQSAFIDGGINRVILATDGDFNVGISDHEALIDLISKKRERGIALTTLGFGQGNYNDYLMEQLANAGNGNYAYIDNINEARKVLVDELQSSMQMIAKDVKIQVEFNPALVAEYRLIGYDNRALANEDFNNDRVDAGDIGAGHQVTALYEITLSDSRNKFNDALRYSSITDSQVNEASSKQGAQEQQELAHVKLRFKQPDANTSQLIESVIYREAITSFEQQSDDFKFAVAVATFAERIKQSKYATNLDYTWIASTAQGVKGDDNFGYRSEFIQLVNTASALH